MVRKQYNIVFYGEVVTGYSVEDVRHNLVSQFRLDSETREQLFAGKTVVIREHMDYMAASTLQTNCELQGAIFHVELSRVKTQYNVIDVSKLCNIEFKGKTVIGRQIEDVKDKLRVLLKADRQAIEQLFSGKQVVIKKDVDYQTALNIEAGFEQSGAICSITASDKSFPQDKALQKEIFLPINLEMMICPKCGARQKVAPTCEKCGIVVGKFVKKKRVVKHESPQKIRERKGQATVSHEQYADEEDVYEDVETYEEKIIEEEQIGPKQIPVWQIGLVGNVILTLLLTLFGVSFYKIMVTFSLNPEIYTVDVEFDNMFALLLSNAQIAGLIGIIVPLLVYFRRTLYKMDRPALRYRFWAALLTVIGATLMIDAFVFMRTGVAFVGAFTLKAFGLSAIAYLIGFGVFLVIKRKELLMPPETEEMEIFEDEEAGTFDEEEIEDEENV
jgi:ribosomal protein L40E